MSSFGKRYTLFVSTPGWIIKQVNSKFSLSTIINKGENFGLAFDTKQKNNRYVSLSAIFSVEFQNNITKFTMRDNITATLITKNINESFPPCAYFLDNSKYSVKFQLIDEDRFNILIQKI